MRIAWSPRGAYTPPMGKSPLLAPGQCPSTRIMTPAMAQVTAEAIAATGAIYKACRLPGVPAEKTIYRELLREDGDGPLTEAIARARRVAGHTQAEMGLREAETLLADAEDPATASSVTKERARATEHLGRFRQWLASKWSADYRDRAELEVKLSALIAFADVGAQAVARATATLEGGELGPPAPPHVPVTDGADEAPEVEG